MPATSTRYPWKPTWQAWRTHSVRERYSVVLLSASDVMDEIFVARYLAQHAPDLTVVISDADELFLREGQDMSLQNTYTVSVWPLMERNISWTSSSPRDVQVPTSSSDEGSASALHYLVCASVLTGGSACMFSRQLQGISTAVPRGRRFQRQ